MEVFSSHPENTDNLDEYLQNDDDDDAITVPEIVKIKRKRGWEEIFDEIIMEIELMMAIG